MRAGDMWTTLRPVDTAAHDIASRKSNTERGEFTASGISKQKAVVA
jgi:hypothetical protein